MRKKYILRQNFVDELIKLNGIRYQDMGRNEHGLDCIGLPIFALSKLKMKVEGDRTFYSPIANGRDLQEALELNCKTKAFKEMQKGDLLLIRYSSTPHHLAIFLGDYYNNGSHYIIHASNLTDRKVKIERFENWEKRVISIHSFNFFKD